MSTNVTTTKGLPQSTRCVFISQDEYEGTCEVEGAVSSWGTLSVRITVRGQVESYTPNVSTLASTHEGDYVLVEVSDSKWGTRIVDIDDAVDAAQERARAKMPAIMMTPSTVAPRTQHARVLAGFALLYNDALNEDAYNAVRVTLNDSSDEATDDGSIDVAIWQLFTSHCEAFEDVQDTYRELQEAMSATRETVPEKK